MPRSVPQVLIVTTRFAVEPADEASFRADAAAALRALADDPGRLEAMGKRAAETARGYGRAASVERWNELLERVVTGRDGRPSTPAFASRSRS
jgi:hypothetical protein